MKPLHVLLIVLAVIAVDHMVLSNEIHSAKEAAIDEAGDLDRSEVKDSCLK